MPKIPGIFKTKKSKTIIKTGANVAVLLIVFGVGVAFGQGKIVFGPDAMYHRSTQKNSPEKIDTAGVQEVYKMLRQSFDGELDSNKLEDGMKSGLVRAAGDPYTEFLNAEDSKQFEEQLSGSFEGIGAELSKDGNNVVIVSPIAGYPAEKAGLKPKDIIVKINDEDATDLTVTEAVNKIRGPKGTNVKLTVARDGKPLEFTITRETISLPSVEHKMEAGNVGVITISRYGEDTVELATKAANDLKAQGAKGIVLDLRGNPGGLLDAAVGVSSLWLDKGATVLQEKRNGVVVRTYYANGNNPLKGMPTIVLIDDGSASASEITAGALKDNKVATLLGTKSYGKGSVQEIRELTSGGTLKVTVARWFTPSGKNIDKHGIEPDTQVEITDENIKAKQDPQLDTALGKLRQ